MKRTILLMFSAVVMLSTTSCLATTKPPASKLAVKVVDDTGEPVSNAYVEAWTYWEPENMPWGFTDSNGIFHYTDRVYREIGYLARKKGYYDSLGTSWWPKKLFEVPETNLVVVLKRIIDPVEMNERRVRTFLPRIGVPIGFDLACGDWVSPDGTGVYGDIQFVGFLRYENRFNHEVRVSGSFEHLLNGIQAIMSSDGLRLKSSLKYAQVAPETGYEPHINMWQFNSKETGFGRHNITDRGYIFRTRTATNEVGEIISANYGWTDGEITIDEINGERIALSFRYYYNPDPTSRSLEPKEIADQQAKGIPMAVK